MLLMKDSPVWIVRLKHRYKHTTILWPGEVERPMELYCLQ